MQDIQDSGNYVNNDKDAVGIDCSGSVSARGSHWVRRFFLLNALGLLALVASVWILHVPPGKLHIVRFDPQEEVESEAIGSVSVEFGAELAPESVGKNAVALSPVVPGHLEFSEGRILKYILEEPLAKATRYRINLSPSLHGLRGERVSGKIMEFFTPGLAVKSITQAGIERGDRVTLAVVFNNAVNPEELRENLTVNYKDGEPLDFTVGGGKPDTRILVTIENVRQDSISLALLKGLSGVDGPLGLSADYKTMVRILTENHDGGADLSNSETRVITVTPNVRFLGMSANNYYSGNPRIRVKMNTPIDVNRAADYITITPDVPHNFQYWRSGFSIIGKFCHGKRYRVTLKKGLPAGTAGSLHREISRTVWFPDRGRSLNFAFGGGYLAPQGLLKVPVKSVNLRGAQLKVSRLYASNVVEHVLNGSRKMAGDVSTFVAERKLIFDDRPNEEVETLLDLRELVGNEPRGVYSLFIRNDDYYWKKDRAVVVVTDMGLSSRISDDRVLCWVTSLSSAKPLLGVKVSLYSDKRQKLGSGVTDDKGLVEIPVPRLPDGENAAMLLAVSGKDMSYLEFFGNGVSRGLEAGKGRAYLREGYEVFSSTERGVYRPGDKVFVSAFVRGKANIEPAAMPLDMIVMRPDGREFLKRRIICEGNGRLLGTIEIPNSAPSGYYNISFRLPGKQKDIGISGFRVADYIPQTLKMVLNISSGRLNVGKSLSVKAEVKHLFGGPARGLKIKGRVQYDSADFKPKGWGGFSFGDARVTDSRSSVSLSEILTDEYGIAEFKVTPTRISSRAAVKMTAEIEVNETGGRALNERLSWIVDQVPFYLGLKMQKKPARPQEEATLILAAVKPDGTVDARGISWRAKLYVVNYSYVLRRLNGTRLGYEWTRHESEEASLSGILDKGHARLCISPKRPGSYRMVVEADGGCAVTRDFYVTGTGGGWLAHDPDRVEIRLDRKRYAVGEEAICTFQAPFAGTALVCTEGAEISDKRLVEFKQGKNLLKLEVRREWQPNVYVTATLIRSVKPDDDWRPHRASGLERLEVDCADRKLNVEIVSAEITRPTTPLSVSVRVKTTGGEPVKNAAVVFAAVDEGVLALTDYKAVSPFDYFYALRRLDIREIDMYNRLAPELSRWRSGNEPEPGGGSRIGGGIPEMARRLNPIQAKRVKSAVLYEGKLFTDETGVAKAEFMVPEYLGKLRMMAYAAVGDNFGFVRKNLSVSSPVMFRASWPRFLTPGDSFDVPITIFNRSEKDGEVSLDLKLDGHLRQESVVAPIFVKAGGEETLRLRFKAVSIGKTVARLEVRLGDELYAETLEMPVRPAAAFDRRSGFTKVDSGKEETVTVAGEFLPGTGKSTVLVTGNPVAEVSGSLQYLLQYPYGCLEQTTSRMVPLLYAQDLAAMVQPGTIGRGEVNNLLRAGFLRLEIMQTYNGGLAMWPGNREAYDWGTIYACDMMTEAKKAGYDIPDKLYDSALSYIEKRMSGWAAFSREGNCLRIDEASYGCYVLARAGKRPLDWIVRLDELIRKYDEGAWGRWRMRAAVRCHVAAAYLFCGERDAARKLLNKAVVSTQKREAGRSLGSPLREASVMLLTLLDVEPDSPRIPQLVSRLRVGLSDSYWGTTQENAFALMALGKYARRTKFDSDGTITVSLQDGTAKTGHMSEGLSLSDVLPGQSIKVEAKGNSPAYIYWYAEGVPLSGKVETKHSGMVVVRSICDMDGKEVKGAKLKQGGLYQVALQVRSQRRVENGVIVDLLPAGLELENQDLKGSATMVKKLTRSKVSSLIPVHTEPRDDRLLVFTDFPEGVSEYRYLVRAVTSGKFAWPAVEASCMYDPEIYSVAGASELCVEP